MKTRNFLLLAIVLFSMNGCLVKSLHPFFKQENVVFNRKLTGNWLDQDSSLWEISQYKRSKSFLKEDSIYNAYTLKIQDESGKISILNGTLFKLGENLYFDFYPDELELSDFYSYHIVPTHSIAKVDIVNNHKIEIKWFRQDWLNKMFSQNRIKISHEIISNRTTGVDSIFIITASTHELQKFLIKYGNDPKVYGCENNEGLCMTLTKTNE